MLARCSAVLLALLFLALPAAAQDDAREFAREGDALQSPAAFLGYALGTRFTPHHRVVDYVQHVAAASPRVQLERYGTTHEGRPLMVAFVTAPENMERLEEIRQSNLRRAGMEPGRTSPDDPALVWMSYGVHGNESASTEAALAALHALADPSNARTQAWMQDVVAIIDPCVNPDGRDRYVHWYKETVGRTPNARPVAREHREPWPGGRTNHYYFDLNRDWAWGAQQETRHRLALYHQWMPHLHADYHEQGVESPYYFAPGAEPFHRDITAFQRAFQQTIGQNNADAFDDEGWLYFTGERFDLFYPGYGDTWPLFNGAVGMTYEQGGSGRAGLAIQTTDGDTLSLKDRVAHHVTTSLSNVEVAARERQRLLSNFADYYATAQSDPPGPYEAYVVKTDRAPGRAKALAELLEMQGIRYGYATRNRSMRGFDYAAGRDGRARVAPGDLVVSAYQPKARLAKVLFEPRPELADSLTYDITAWALPYAYNVEAYALTERLEPDAAAPPEGRVTQNGSRDEVVLGDSGKTPYAYLAPWGSLAEAKLLAAWAEAGLSVRVAEGPFRLDGRDWPAGTLMVTRAGNRGFEGRLRQTVQAAADSFAVDVTPVATGFVQRGADFGSGGVRLVGQPRVAVLAGESVSPYGAGEVWHFFEERLRYPSTVMPPDGFDPADLTGFDVLVLPDGRYGEILPEETLAAVRGWVQRGGRLLALEGAAAFLAGKDGFGLQEKDASEDDTTAAPEQRRYAERERTSATENVPGSVFRVTADGTHPLAFGLGDTYYTLKRGTEAFALLEDGWNVGVLDTPAAGFTGSDALERLGGSLVVGTEAIGRGHVVYFADDPLFRGFWEAGAVLFSNAVFMVGAE